MTFVDDLLLQAFLPFSLLKYLAGSVTLPFRGVGVGFEEKNLRIMF